MSCLVLCLVFKTPFPSIPRAEEAADTMALSFALLLELGDPQSKWKPYWDSFPKDVPNIFDFDGDLVRVCMCVYLCVSRVCVCVCVCVSRVCVCVCV